MRTSEYTDACCRGLFARIVCRAGLLFFILSISGLASFAQIITTYAGGPPLPVSGQPAVTQAIAVPGSVAPDGAGGFFVFTGYHNGAVHGAGDGLLAVTGGSRIPKVTRAGAITTVAGNLYPTGVVVDGAGNLFIADSGNQRIWKVTPAATITTVAGNGKRGFSGGGGPPASPPLSEPAGAAGDAAGEPFFSRPANPRKPHRCTPR